MTEKKPNETDASPLAVEEDREPGPLLSAWYAVLDMGMLFFDFFRRNGFLVLLLAMAAMVALLRLSPTLFGRRTLLLAGFAVVVVLMVALVISNYRTLRHRREEYVAARKGREDGHGDA